MKKSRILTLIGGVACFATLLGLQEDSLAYTAPSVSIDIGAQEKSGEVRPSAGHLSAGEIYVPITVTASNAKNYAIYFYTENSELRDGEKSIPSLDAATTTTLFSDSMVNRWGYRASVGADAAEVRARAKKASFAAVPTISQGLHSATIPEGESITTHLGLDFGVVANGDVPNGIYTNKVYVSVTASPLELSMLDITYFQEMTPEICNNTITGVEGELTDSRDGKVYKVAKLADNNCWMIQNLALEGGTAITNSDSDVASNYTLPKSNTDGFVNYDDKNMYNGTHEDDKYDNNPVSVFGLGDGTGDNTGAYYTWLTAVANSPEASESSGEASYSICPKGWGLPTGGAGGQFDSLYNSYSATDDKTQRQVLIDAWHNGFAGNYLNSTLYGSGAIDYYWSKTFPGWSSAYIMQINSSITTDGNFGRSLGNSIRCVAHTDDRTMADITYMQDMTRKVCSNTTVGTELTLTDKRDNKKYKVTKLADGNCWMTQNLALEGGTTVTNADSDVVYPYTLPASSTTGFNDNAGQFMFNGSHTDGTDDTIGYDGTGESGKDGTNSGAYYSWLTATAQTVNFSDSGNVATSICPKGWKLPSGMSGTGQLQTLYNSYSASDGKTKKENFDAAWQPGYAGYYANSSIDASNSFSYWWSNTIGSDINAYYMYENTANSINLSDNNNRKFGRSVRCVFQS